MKFPVVDARSRSDCPELHGEVIERTAAVFYRPCAKQSTFLNAIVANRGNKHVRVSLGLFRLMFSQQLNEFIGQRQSSTVGIFNVPLPCMFGVLLGRNMDFLASEINVPSGSVQQLTPAHPGAEGCVNQQLPFHRVPVMQFSGSL